MPKFLIPNRIVALALALALDVLKRVNRAQVICTCQFDARDTNTLLIMLKRNETQQNYVELNSSLKIILIQRNLLAILQQKDNQAFLEQFHLTLFKKCKQFILLIKTRIRIRIHLVLTNLRKDSPKTYSYSNFSIFLSSTS